MQAQDLAEDKMEQNEDLAKLRAGVSLAKTGVQQAANKNRGITCH